MFDMKYSNAEIELKVLKAFDFSTDNFTINYTFFRAPFGELLIAATDKAILDISFIESKEIALSELKEKYPSATLVEAVTELHDIANRIFCGDRIREKLPLLVTGTPFQEKVWNALLQIPFGSVVTYTDIAQSIGQPFAQRAVGSAIGANSIAYIIPCHRVVRSNGGIGGYRWGEARKIQINEWEATQKRLAS